MTTTTTTTTRDAILSVLGAEHQTVTEISKAAGCARSTVQRQLTSLLEEGLVHLDESGKSKAYAKPEPLRIEAPASTELPKEKAKKVVSEGNTLEVTVTEKKKVKRRATAREGFALISAYDVARIETRDEKKAKASAAKHEAVKEALLALPEHLRRGAVDQAMKKTQGEEFEEVLKAALAEVPTGALARGAGGGGRRGRRDRVMVRKDGPVLVVRTRLPEGFAEYGDIVHIAEEEVDGVKRLVMTVCEKAADKAAD